MKSPAQKTENRSSYEENASRRVDAFQKNIQKKKPLEFPLNSFQNIEIYLQKPQTTYTSRLADFFPYLSQYRPLSNHTLEKTPQKVGVVFSGGPAPGGNNVVCAIFHTLLELSGKKSELIGFMGGPKGLIENTFRTFEKSDIDHMMNMGGFDALVSGRTKIESEEDMDKVMKTLIQHNLDGLVIIGGDDSNTNAAYIAEEVLKRRIPCTVIGVPKTIDGDLQSEHVPISFGFDTATKVYSHLIGNIAKDCLSTKKYFFFVRVMGRAASHIALECALQTQPNLVFISEEVRAAHKTLKEVVLQITDLIIDRVNANKPYGLILIPEGLIESMSDVQKLITELNQLLSPNHQYHAELATLTTPRKRLSYVLDHLSAESKKTLIYFPTAIELQLLEDRDPHGNVQVSQIETERLLEALVLDELRHSFPEIARKVSTQTCFYGYEGRSSYPTVFDSEYCYNLGRCAIMCIFHKMHGVLAGVTNLDKPVAEWKPVAIPLLDLMVFEQRGGKEKPVIRKVLVDLKGPLFSLFAKKRESWRLSDEYLFPPPIQFFGKKEISHEPCLYVLMKKYQDSCDSFVCSTE